MDIGFGALIEKFEEYVGRGPTRLLIIVIFVAVFALCAKAISDNLVSPVLDFFRTPLWGSTLVEIAFLAGGAAAGVTGGVYAMASFAKWQATKRALANLKKAKVLKNTANDSARNASVMLDQSSGMLDDVSELNRKSVAMTRMLVSLIRYQMENPTKFPSDKLKQIEAMLEKAESELEITVDEGYQAKDR